jgi:hypothetical protein
MALATGGKTVRGVTKGRVLEPDPWDVCRFNLRRRPMARFRLCEMALHACRFSRVEEFFRLLDASRNVLSSLQFFFQLARHLAP